MSGVEYTRQEREQAYRQIEHIVDRFKIDDAALSAATQGRLPRAGLPDGYPRGGDGPGSGVSDPTGAAVDARDRALNARAQDARQATRLVMQALAMLRDADRLRHQITDIIPTSTRERSPEIACEDCGQPRWCISCLRPRPGEHTSTPIALTLHACKAKKHRRDLCHWCLNRTTNGVLPDVRLVAWHADNPGAHLTQDVADRLTQRAKR